MRFEERLDLDSGLARSGREGQTGGRMRALLADCSDERGWLSPYAVFRARKRG